MKVYPSSTSKRKAKGASGANGPAGKATRPGTEISSRSCRAILDVFAAGPEKTLNAREIHHRLMDTPRRANLSTVYRNLARLEREKIVIGLPIPPGDDRSRRYRLK